MNNWACDNKSWKIVPFHAEKSFSVVYTKYFVAAYKLVERCLCFVLHMAGVWLRSDVALVTNE